MDGSCGIDGSELRNVDLGPESSHAEMERRKMDLGLDHLLFGSSSQTTLPTYTLASSGAALSQPLTFSAAAGPLSAQETIGYNLRSTRIPNSGIDFSEVLRHRAISEQQSLAASWTKATQSIEAETNQLKSNLYSLWEPSSATQIINRLEIMWNSFEQLHARYLQGIKERKRLEVVEEKYISLKGYMMNTIEECKKQMEIDNQRLVQDDNISVRSYRSSASKTSSTSSQREKLRTMLIAKKKLELARTRERQEAERVKQLHKLEEEVALAELDWQLETEYDEETRRVGQASSIVKHSTPFDPLARETDPKTYNSTVPTCQNISRPSTTTRPLFLETPGASNKKPTPKFSIEPPTNSKRTPTDTLESSQAVHSSGSDRNACPIEPMSAMWKIQLLNGIKPTQFSGKPSDFPFFRSQVQTHLEGDLLTDSQRLEYLPKFLSGEALEVIKRNRGCSYETLLKTLEERFGRPIQVAHHCIEELVSGPKIAYGDNAALLNYAEQLTTATKVLSGEYEQEVSVATNLRKIISRLPNDMITKWQNVNYEISKERRARLKDVATFVHKQAIIKNDPVFGSQRRETQKENKHVSKYDKTQVSRKSSAFGATSVDTPQRSSSSSSKNCDICKGHSHKLPQCPVILRCERAAVRRQYAASYRFCFNCGIQQPGHGSGNCPEPPACKRCSAPHLDILHVDLRKPSTFKPSLGGNTTTLRSGTKDYASNNSNDSTSQERDKPRTDNGSTTVTSAGASTKGTRVLLNVVPVTVTADNGNSTSTYAFLDNGCTETLLDQALADRLGIQGVPEEIQINTITNTHVPRKSYLVRFTMAAADGTGEDIEVEGAYVLPDLNQSQQDLPGTIDVSQYPHLRDLQFPSVEVRRISIIVGNNVPTAHVQSEVRTPEGTKDGLFGFRYPLGWSIAGPLNLKSRRSYLNYISVDHQLNLAIERFWDVEDYGTAKSNENPLSVDDKRALKVIENTTRYVDGHYEVGLLWKQDDPHLPNNRSMAEKRLQSLKRRLTNPRNAEMAVKYCDVINDYVNQGYARLLTPAEAAQESHRCWYLPHHPVTNPNKPEKLRIVFDAAAEFQETSLNKNLVQGPDVTNSLVGVLLRFRQGNVAFAADVQAMFHQVRVKREDQDALRFLWWTKGFDEPPDVYAMQVHIFGATSSPCVANSVLKMTANDNAEDFSAETVNAVKNNFYVDDALPSAIDEPSAIRLASEMVELLHRGGFHLTKFTSSSKHVLSTIPNDRRANPELSLDLDELPVERALGIRWFAETDELGFDVKDLHRPETKRGILSTVSSLYDPLGFASPVTLTARALIQELWKAKVDWDQPLDDRFLNKWRGWKELLLSLSQIRIPRSYFQPQTDVSLCQLQLHHFSDASEIGYGTVSYLRIKYPDDTIQCSFIMGKARNAPIKFISIPRLELQAAVLSTRMNKMLRQQLELPIERSMYWTDSEIVLHYLRNRNRRFQTFVANRIEEMKENSLVEEWNHVPGPLNPADDASRGLSPSDLSLDHRWLRGPQFLWQSESCWPRTSLGDVPEERLEIKNSSRKVANLNATSKEHNLDEDTKVLTESPPTDKIPQLIANCSDWITLQRRIAWLIRFVHFVRDPKSVRTGRLKLEDYQKATLAIARIAQKAVYTAEINDLNCKPSNSVKGTSKIANLNPILDDDGILRVNGRIGNAPVPYSARQQIILPRKHHVTYLIAQHTHLTIGHLGREHVIAKLRERYWIPQVRVLVRAIVSRCLTCKKINSKPMKQQMAPLPKDRLTAFEPPFSYTGMDLFGPLYVKHGRGTAKRWCCLFTCLNTRCIHLELVNSLNTDDFIMCLRRFVNRRGEIAELRCDNGTNFVGGERELKEGIRNWNQNQIDSALIQRGCKWTFQPPTASSMSGVWERMVRSAKTVLKSIVGSQTVTDTVLHTLLTEVERVLNGRALTSNSDDPNDFQALTPAHFLMQRKTICLPPGIFDETDLYSRRKWRQVQFLADTFWKRWLREYLPSLQARSKWHKALPNIKPNALVLLVDHNAHRGHWNLGRVLEVYPGPDGIVRTVKVKTRNTELIRPIQKLCLLENDLEAINQV